MVMYVTEKNVIFSFCVQYARPAFRFKNYGENAFDTKLILVTLLTNEIRVSFSYHLYCFFFFFKVADL